MSPPSPGAGSLSASVIRRHARRASIPTTFCSRIAAIERPHDVERPREPDGAMFLPHPRHHVVVRLERGHVVLRADQLGRVLERPRRAGSPRRRIHGAADLFEPQRRRALGRARSAPNLTALDPHRRIAGPSPEREHRPGQVVGLLDGDRAGRRPSPSAHGLGDSVGTDGLGDTPTSDARWRAISRLPVSGNCVTTSHATRSHPSLVVRLEVQDLGREGDVALGGEAGRAGSARGADPEEHACRRAPRRAFVEMARRARAAPAPRSRPPSDRRGRARCRVGRRGRSRRPGPVRPRRRPAPRRPRRRPGCLVPR